MTLSDILSMQGDYGTKRRMLDQLANTPGVMMAPSEYEMARGAIGQADDESRLNKQIARYEMVSSPEYGQKLYEQELSNRKAEAELQKQQNDLVAQRAVPSGRWKDVRGEGGKMYLINDVTGEIKPAEVGGQQLVGEMPGAAKAKPATDSGEYVKSQAEAMRRQLASVVGLDVANYSPAQLEEYFGEEAPKANVALERLADPTGVIQSKIPAWMSFNQEKEDVGVAIQSLREMSQKFGVQALRSAGVAPGSITEKEWSKFENDLATLNPAQSKEAVYQQMRGLYNQLNKAIAQSEKDMAKQGAAPATVAPAQTAPKGAAVPVKSIDEANTLPPGTTFILNGRRGIVR